METRTAGDYRLSWLASFGQRIGFDTKILRHFNALAMPASLEFTLKNKNG
jgi:hypothetical protein